MTEEFYGPIREAAAILEDAKEKVAEKLSAQQHSSLALATGPQIQSIINRLHFISNTPAKHAVKQKNKYDKPVTNFLGEKIALPKTVQPIDLEPGKDEVAIFRERVQELGRSIGLMSPEAVLAQFVGQDEFVIRGLAKSAGFHDYEDAELTVEYVEKIQDELAKRERQAAAEAEAEAGLAAAIVSPKLDEADNTDGADEGDDQEYFDHTVTEQDLIDNPHWAEEGFEVGEVVQIPVNQDFDDEDTPEAEADEPGTGDTEKPAAQSGNKGKRGRKK